MPLREPLESAPRVPGLLWACFEHWQELPPRIKQGISSAYYGPGPGSAALETAKQRAFAYWSRAAGSAAGTH
jgi:hypothetical protein